MPFPFQKTSRYFICKLEIMDPTQFTLFFMFKMSGCNVYFLTFWRISIYSQNFLLNFNVNPLNISYEKANFFFSISAFISSLVWSPTCLSNFLINIVLFAFISIGICTSIPFRFNLFFISGFNNLFPFFARTVPYRQENYRKSLQTGSQQLRTLFQWPYLGL